MLTTVDPTVPNVAYEHCYLTGWPVAHILEFAEQKRIDLIVMVSRRRTGLSKMLMKSVAEGVIRGAKCPVLIVKQPVKQPETSDVCLCNENTCTS